MRREDSILLGTTEEFLLNFDVQGLDALPRLTLFKWKIWYRVKERRNSITAIYRDTFLVS